MQLGQKLCGYLEGNRNLLQVEPNLSAMLLDAVNIGLSQMAQFMPAQRFTSMAQFPIGAPRSETVTINAPGDVTVFPSMVVRNDVGKSVLLGDDPGVNRTVMVLAGSSATLARPYAGIGGEQLFTLYDDAVPFDWNEASIRRESAAFASASGGRRALLTFCDSPPGGIDPLATAASPTHCWIEDFAPMRFTQYAELPHPEYTIVSLADAAGAWLLRLWPLPLEAGFLEVELRAGETGTVLKDFHTARSFRFSPIEAAHLVALAAEGLPAAVQLAPNVTRDELRRAADRARAWLNSLSSSRLHGVQKLANSPGY